MNSRSKLLILAIPAISLVAGLAIFPLVSSNGYSYTYYVQPGDTLYQIGVMFNVDWHSIASTNDLRSPYTIYVGEPLTIPLPSTSVNYAVQSGDTLRGIGQKFEVDWTSIASENGLNYPYLLTVGQVLVIPLISAPGGSGLVSSSSSSSAGSTTVTTTITVPGTSVATVTSTATATDSTTLTSTAHSTSLTTLSTTNTAYVTSTSYVTLTSTQVATQTVTAPVTVTSTTTATATDTITQTMTTTSTSAPGSSDPLATGNSLYDQYDATILAAAAQYNLDPVVLKSQVAQESYFNSQAVSPDDPCGSLIQNGIDVGHSYGLMQMTPLCMSWFARNPDGTVDLATSQYSSQWGNSAYNPIYNIYSAALAWYGNLQYAHQQFPGCTQNQYVYVGLSAYNAGFGSVYSCTSYNSQGTTYVNSVMSWYQRFSTMSGWPDPY